jgi:hypothetical protein
MHFYSLQWMEKLNVKLHLSVLMQQRNKLSMKPPNISDLTEKGNELTGKGK